MKLKPSFLTELRKSNILVKKIYEGKRKIEELPIALQKYLIRSGFTAYPKLHRAEISWKNSYLKLSKDAVWRAISCKQYNFLPDPIRLAYMKTNIWGFFGVEAIDSFRHGKGGMHVKALGVFDITNSTGEEMNKSALVTILAETIIIPDYALHSYIHWEEIDLYTVRGVINYYGLKATGTFYFNEHFDIVRFETSDRYLTQKDGSFKQTNWTTVASDFVNAGNIRFPSYLTATWNMGEEDFLYFKGEITSIKLKQ